MGIIFHVSSRFLYAYFKINLKSGTGNGIRISLRFRIPDNIPSYSKSRTTFHQKIEYGTQNPERTRQRTYRRAHRRNHNSQFTSEWQISTRNRDELTDTWHLYAISAKSRWIMWSAWGFLAWNPVHSLFSAPHFKQWNENTQNIRPDIAQRIRHFDIYHSGFLDEVVCQCQQQKVEAKLKWRQKLWIRGLCNFPCH